MLFNKYVCGLHWILIQWLAEMPAILPLVSAKFISPILALIIPLKNFMFYMIISPAFTEESRMPYCPAVLNMEL